MILGWLQAEGASAEFASHITSEHPDYLSPRVSGAPRWKENNETTLLLCPTTLSPSCPPTNVDSLQIVLLPSITEASPNCQCRFSSIMKNTNCEKDSLLGQIVLLLEPQPVFWNTKIFRTPFIHYIL